jgi:cell wall-associated NlpC family hydrolase
VPAETQEIFSLFSGKSSRTVPPAVLSLAVVALAIPAIFATVALPAYAARPAGSTSGADATAQIQQMKASGAQAVSVADDATAATISRDGFTATSEAELTRAKLKAQLAAVKYTGPSVRALLANPPYPSFSLDQVVAVAERYQGVPYVYGGASPAGFDCSGFTQFVYAQFGVSLPHSAARQGSGGAQISAADARPGDIVAMDGGGHVGIYLGGDMMIDAPMPGRVVQIRAIYTSAHWFVRYGI